MSNKSSHNNHALKNIIILLKNILTVDTYYGEVVIVFRDGAIHSVRKTENVLVQEKRSGITEKPNTESL